MLRLMRFQRTMTEYSIIDVKCCCPERQCHLRPQIAQRSKNPNRVSSHTLVKNEVKFDNCRESTGCVVSIQVTMAAHPSHAHQILELTDIYDICFRTYWTLKLDFVAQWECQVHEFACLDSQSAWYGNCDAQNGLKTVIS